MIVSYVVLILVQISYATHYVESMLSIRLFSETPAVADLLSAVSDSAVATGF
jgi:hypothetical protein